MSRARSPLWRSVLSGLFLVVFVLAAPVALTAGWARVTLLDGDVYAGAVAGVADDPRLPDALSQAISQQALASLAGDDQSATAAVQRRLISEAIGTAIRQVVETPEFDAAWVAANRGAHAALAAGLSGGQGSPVVLDLSPLASEAQAAIEASNVALPVPITITPQELQIEVLDVATADRLRRVLREVTIASWVSLGVAILALVVSVALANDRWQALAREGFGLALGMVALMAAMLVATGVAAQAVGSGAGGDVLLVLTDALSQNLRLAAIGSAVGGLILAGLFAGLGALTRGTRRVARVA
jgi:hypothetical protein